MHGILYILRRNTMERNEDFIYNWSNSLRKTDDGELVVATRIASRLKDKGYSETEASDMMIADSYSLNAVESAIGTIFASNTKDKKVEASRKTFVIPTSYEDVKPIVEESLAKYSAKEFIDRLSKTEYPILSKIASKQLDSLCRLAANAKSDNTLLNQLHGTLSPFVETAMYNAVLASEKLHTKLSVSKSDNRYVVASANAENNVCLKSGTCNCDKYVKGNYSDFGIACEHLISVASMVSPNHKLVRDEIID